MTNEELIKTLNLRFTSGNTTPTRDIRLTKEEYEQLLIVSDLNHSKILTCVYCGHEYPQDTPSHGNSVLTEHIKVCAKHPASKLFHALAQMVGTSEPKLLNEMIDVIYADKNASEEDKRIALIGINALLEFQT